MRAGFEQGDEVKHKLEKLLVEAEATLQAYSDSPKGKMGYTVI